MWTHSTAGATQGRISTLPIEYLADIVNKLSHEDYRRFRQCLRPSLASEPPGIQVNTPDDAESTIDQLTRRESEVLVLVASGYSRKEIGVSLGISENTAASHIASIYRKLDIRSIAEATNIAIRLGVI